MWQNITIYLHEVTGIKTAADIIEDVNNIKTVLYCACEINYCLVGEKVLNVSEAEIEPGKFLKVEIVYAGEGRSDLLDDVIKQVTDRGYDYYIESCPDNEPHKYLAKLGDQETQGVLCSEYAEPYALLNDLKEQYKDMTGAQIAETIQGLWGEESYYIVVGQNRPTH